MKGKFKMNDNQKERLLKIAENNPELAKDVVDILKQESSSTQEPIAVKMVKSKDDKITINQSQKNKAITAVLFFILAALSLIFSLIYGFSSIALGFTPHESLFLIGLAGFFIFGVVSDTIIAKSIGIPVIKKVFPKYFKLIK